LIFNPGATAGYATSAKDIRRLHGTIMADKITEAVDATPYPKAPSIWIAYPQLDDWKRLFVPVFDPKRASDIHWLQAKYAFMKSSHETFVTTQLNAIASKPT